MPNWCYNSVTFSHKDPEQVNRLKHAIEQEALFKEFFPCPPALLEQIEMGDNYNERYEARQAENLAKHGFTGWYDWSVENWGTKWDIGCSFVTDDTDPNIVSCTYDTAWSPPIAFYEKMAEIGWDIDAEYSEEGMGFVGYFTNEEGDEYFELNFEHFDEDWMENFPLRLHEIVEQQYESWRDWQEQEKEDESTEHADDH